MALRISGDGSLNYLDAALNNVTASGLSASGNVVLPSTTEIGAVSSTELGYVDGVTSALQTQLNTLDSGLASKLDLAGGKILQIVRATDSTSRTTTSTSFVDVTGMSVTITPQKSDSAVLLAAFGNAYTLWSTGDSGRGIYQIADNSNNAVGGAEELYVGTNNITGTGSREFLSSLCLFAYSTPATTSAVTYKLRFKAETANVSTRMANNLTTGQMYAIEVSA